MSFRKEITYYLSLRLVAVNPLFFVSLVFFGDKSCIISKEHVCHITNLMATKWLVRHLHRNIKFQDIFGKKSKLSMTHIQPTLIAR